ncbi:MAG: glycosyltransferase family 2 protein, partial [Planctomycetota bacterium]
DDAAVAGADASLEVVVLDDHSTDATARLVEELSRRDSRVRLIRGKELPAGWNGKQHACWQLAAAARNDVLIFLDADVRVAPDAVARVAAEVDRGADLVSGFPRQITGSLLERLLIPLVHFVLLGFLSLRALRSKPRPGMGAGCGQLFATTKSAYERAGGHAAIRASRHDGVKLPRRYLSEGLSVDLFDATDLAAVRMYDGARATWNGLSKNADEGIANWALLPMVTVVLLLGQVAPFGCLAAALITSVSGLAIAISGSAASLAVAPRLDAARRFDQSWLGAVLHPVGVLLFLAVQWSALVAKMSGRQVAWKGRPAAAS